jgi:hypothetical protein
MPASPLSGQTKGRPSTGTKRATRKDSAAIAGLALWWYDHREVPREQVVAAAMNALWVGFERLGHGERWQP